MQPRGDVGVLLVHGIGDHEEGETLTAFGEPLLDWIRAWLRGRSKATDDPVLLSGARLRAARNEAESPACAEAVIRGYRKGHEGQEHEERWLLCEAWWGDSVHPPDALKLLLWLWSRGPLLICWHFFMQSDVEAASSRRARERLGARVFAAVGLAGACQLVVTVALLLWLIPIGRWRGAVARTVRALTLTLGDSFVLLEHDIQRAALVQRVQRSLAWLTERCTRVAVVAHSQGGAIAYEALASADRAKVEAFVSVGSGLEKLLFLRMVRRDGTGIIPAALVAPVMFAALAFGGSGFISADKRWQLIPAALFLAAAIGLLARLVLASKTYRTRLATDAARLALHRTTASLVRWTDVAATRDLIPQVNDSLITRQSFVTGYITAHERSYLYDHIGYFQSRTSSMPRIWQALGRASSLHLFDPGDISRLERFDRLHGWHTNVLMIARWITYATLFVALFAFRNTMAVFGGRILTGVDASPFRDLLTPVPTIASGVAWRLQTIGIVTPAVWLSQALVGALVLLSGLALWSLTFRGCWRALAARRWHLACASRDVLDSRAHAMRAWLGCVGLGAVSILPLMYASTMIAAPALLEPSRIGLWFAVALAAICFLAAAAFAAVGPWVWPLHWPLDTMERAETPPAASLVETVKHPLSIVVLLAALTGAGTFVWGQGRDESTAAAITIIAILHAVSWQAYGLWRSRIDVGPFARGSIIVLPAAALLWARASSIANPALIAFIYAGVAIASTIAAVLSRRQRCVQAAILATMRALGRSLLIHR